MLNMDYIPEFQVFGRREDEFIYNPALTDVLTRIGRYLNIKQHSIKNKSSNGTIEIHLSQNFLVYRTDTQTAADLDLRKRDFDQYKRKVDSDPDSKVLLSPDINSNVFYIRNADTIFPIDIEISQRSRLDKRQRLRPEFLREYEKRLNPDTFQDTQGRNQLEQNDFELTEANKELTSKNVLNLVNSLDNMRYLPMDSLGVLRIFHEYGVNMRYLGYVWGVTFQESH